MRLKKQRRCITFRNGFRFRLTWPQFRTLRDSYVFVRNFAVEQLADDRFKMIHGIHVYVGSLITITTICELLQKYTVEQAQENLFRIRNEKFDFIGTSGILVSIWELESGIYNCDCSGKIVLDVGGFQGESAVFFSSLGASKVIVYEPVPSHLEFISKNLSANNVNAEFHIEGVGHSDGTMKVQYDEASLGFGVLDKGRNQLEIKIKDVSKVIKESGADVAKFDCEGAEESLVNVPEEILRMLELYMIEVHTPAIRNAIMEKFSRSGFDLVKEIKRDVNISMLYMKRNHNLGR
jgi:FkbM family methyltransferase